MEVVPVAPTRIVFAMTICFRRRIIAFTITVPP
jgi:hypothetical protein